MMNTNEAINDFLLWIETDTEFQAYCKTTFRVPLTRGRSSRDRTSRITEFLAEPMDWEKIAFNPPIHMYHWITDQPVEDETGWETPVETQLQIVIWFNTDISIETIRDTTDKFRVAIRRHCRVAEPQWTNQGASFFLINETYPAVRITAGLEHRLGGC